jgi:hypothetical protein
LTGPLQPAREGFVEKIVKQGSLLFAIAIVAFGAEHIVCVRFRAFNNTIYSGHEVV